MLYALALMCLLSPPQEPAPRFEVVRADLTAVSGPIQKLEADWSVVLGPLGAKVPGSDLISLRRVGFALPSPPRVEQIVLVNGDRLPGTAIRLAGERLHFQAALGGILQEVRLPIDSLSILWLTTPEARQDLPIPFRGIPAPKRKHDVLLLKNRDILEGSVIAIESSQIEIEERGSRRKLDRSRVAAVAFSTELSRIVKPRQPYARLVLANGSRITLTTAQCDDQALVGKALFGSSLQISLEQLVALDIHLGKATYLSDLTPESYANVSFLGAAWEWSADRNVLGQELRLGESAFDKGIGVHSASTIRYDLSGRYKSFDALVGLDERTGTEGAVVLKVLVDGKERDLGPARNLNGGDHPKKIQINLEGAKELSLVVDFGPRGDIQDHVNFALARLIR